MLERKLDVADVSRAHGERQIELRAARMNRHHVDYERRKKAGRHERRRRGLLDNHDLEDRRRRRVSRRIDGSNDLLERYVALAIGRGGGLSRRLDQLGGVTLQIDAKANDDRVQKETDRVCDSRIAAARHRRADRDVLAVGEPRENGRECSEHHGEGRRSTRSRQLAQLRRKRPRQRSRDASAFRAAAPHRGRERQLEGGDREESLADGLEPRRACGFGLRRTPESQIRSERRHGLAFGFTPDDSREIANENSERRGIGDGVVEHERQHVLFGSEDDQGRAHEWA